MLHFGIQFPFNLCYLLKFDYQPVGTFCYHLRHLYIRDDKSWPFVKSNRDQISALSVHTSLILPVVKMGVTDERISFHSLSWIMLNILRKTLRLTEKLWKQSINYWIEFCLLKKKKKYINSTHSAIDEMVEIFHENWFDKIDVSRVKVGQSSVEITKGSAVLCSHFLVVFWKVLQNSLFVSFTWRKPGRYFFIFEIHFTTSFHIPQTLPKYGRGWGPLIPCDLK